MRDYEKKIRLDEIDKAKGLAILLVVIGHIVARNPPQNNEWYVMLKFLIYKFHMPFFMFLSGLIIQYSTSTINNFIDYKTFVVKKAFRLLPGFFLFGGLILVGKSLAVHFMYVDRPPESFVSGVINMFLDPRKSASSSIWYIYILMQYCLVFPLISYALDKKSVYFFILCIIVYYTPTVRHFMLDVFFEYLIFFSLGVFWAMNYNSYKQIICRYSAVFIILFAISFISINYSNSITSKLIIGLFSIPAIQALISMNPLNKLWQLSFLGLYTYPIYLMNTITIGVTKGAVLKITSWDGYNFMVIFPLLLVAGLLFPILIKRYIFSRIQIIDRITN